MNSEKSIKQQAIEHYDRVIKYAEKSKTKESSSMLTEMLIDINEHIGAKTCPYCRKHKFEVLSANACLNCELNMIGLPMFGCCGGLYTLMSGSETTKEFIKYAKLVRQYIVEHG